MEERETSRRASPRFAVGRILPFPFPGAAPRRRRVFLEGLCTPPLRHYHVNRSTLIGGEAIDLSGAYTRSHATLLARTPEALHDDIFLTIGGRKPVWDMSFVFLHHRILLSVPGIVPSPSQIHFFHLIFSFLFLYDHRRLKEGREVEERDWIVWKYQRLQLLAETRRKRVWRVWLRLNFVACVGAAFFRGNLMANNYTL